jgi:hypothetical protein
MAILDSAVEKAQAGVEKDIAQLGAEEDAVIGQALAGLEAMLRRLAEGYTLEVRLVPKEGVK